MESEKELNSKILEITMTIKEKYPELYEHLEEMPVTLPDIEYPEINSKNLRAYYDSLTSLLKSFMNKHLPDGTK
jgi:hypothetical protein